MDITRRYLIGRGGRTRRGFTLVELLVVVVIIGVLAALLLAGLSRAKAAGRRTVCLNHLSQIGKAMTMYLSENNNYPPALGGPPFQTWADRLTAYNPPGWTNVGQSCPTYVANQGVVRFSPPPAGGGKFEAWTSYAFNADGMVGFGKSGGNLFSKGPKLGLGNLNLTVHEQQVGAPSEMYAVGDARPFLNLAAGGFTGRSTMEPWKLGFGVGTMTEAEAPHAEGYNLMFADVHVELVKRKDYLYPPRSAPHWNRDNQPHPELWAAKSDWAVGN